MHVMFFPVDSLVTDDGVRDRRPSSSSKYLGTLFLLSQVRMFLRDTFLSLTVPVLFSILSYLVSAHTYMRLRLFNISPLDHINAPTPLPGLVSNTYGPAIVFNELGHVGTPDSRILSALTGSILGYVY